MNFSLNDIKAFIIKHYQYVLVAVLFLCLVIVLAIFSKRSKADKPEEVTTSSNVSEESGELVVPDVPLEVDAYDGVNNLVSRYFTAMANGDTATLTTICSELGENEQIRIEKKAEYTESYGNFTCYTKPGPEPDSYIVFAYYEIKFKNIDTLAPGLTSLYVKTADDGTLYVYDGDLTPEISNYIKEIASQDDVVDLLNDVDAKYTAAADSDETLKKFMEALPTALDDAVSAEIAARETAAADAEAAASGDQNTEAKVKETINVRKSASTEADKLGKLMGGDTVMVYETMDNGWSRIDYQGEEAFVKTEYLEMSSPSAEGEADEQQGDEAQAEQPASASSGKKVTINETVNIRKGASTDSSKVASAYKGESYSLIMEQADGWCKIDYKGQEAYVKSEFVTIN